MNTIKDATEYVLRCMTNKAEHAAGALSGFAIKFKEDAYHAFKWADDAMKAAAEYDVANKCAILLRDEEGLEKIGGLAGLGRIVSSRSRDMTRHPSFSTSPCSNVMDQHTASQWLMAAETIEQALSFVAE